jgi:hypothetical protein
MKFRAQTPEDITAEDVEKIKSGEYVEDPKDGILWDAHTAAVVDGCAGHEVPRLLDRIVKILVAIIVALIALGFLYTGVW